jgi:hypothetical protein
MYMKEPQTHPPARLTMAVAAALAVSALVTLLGGIFPSIVTRWAAAPT